jgi:hypothetical protein
VSGAANAKLMLIGEQPGELAAFVDDLRVVAALL